jgi:preprotein translocase subunit YajC
MKTKIAFLNFGSFLISSVMSVSAFAQDAANQVATNVQQVPAAAAAAAAPAAGPAWVNFALMGGIFLFLWLFVLRPQSKRAKEQKEFLSSLTPGVEVITAGGIIGTVVEVKENIVSLNLGNASTVRIVKSSISGRLDTTSAVSAK